MVDYMVECTNLISHVEEIIVWNDYVFSIREKAVELSYSLYLMVHCCVVRG